MLAWRHGSVKVLKILPKPCRIGKKVVSAPYESKRPLIAICDSSSSNPQFSSISISSLKTGEQVLKKISLWFINLNYIFSGESDKIQKYDFRHLCK